MSKNNNRCHAILHKDNKSRCSNNSRPGKELCGIHCIEIRDDVKFVLEDTADDKKCRVLTKDGKQCSRNHTIEDETLGKKVCGQHSPNKRLTAINRSGTFNGQKHASPSNIEFTEVDLFGHHSDAPSILTGGRPSTITPAVRKTTEQSEQGVPIATAPSTPSARRQTKSSCGKIPNMRTAINLEPVSDDEDSSDESDEINVWRDSKKFSEEKGTRL